MKASEIKVGGLYLAKVNNRVVTVRVDSIRRNPGRSYTTQLGTKRTVKESTCYDVTNLATGRKTTFRSAAKFRQEVHLTKTQCPVQDKFPDCGTYAPCPHVPAQSPKVETPAEGEQRPDPTSPEPTASGAGPSAMTPRAQSVVAIPEVVAPSAASSTATEAVPTTAPTEGLLGAFITKHPTQADLKPLPEIIAGMKPTAEQLDGLEKVRQAQCSKLPAVVMSAGAGTGKTAFLKMLECVLSGRGQYTAFNTALVAESKSKFRYVRCNTTHSLAFAQVGRQFGDRIEQMKTQRRMRSEQVAQVLGIADMTLPTGTNNDDGSPKLRVLPAGLLASKCGQIVSVFCQSIDKEVGPQHYRPMAGIDVTTQDEVGSPRTNPENNTRVRDYLLPFARVMWADLSNPKGKLPFSHDTYVKVWQLGEGADRPLIPADFILLDEGQDTAPVFLDVIRRQTHALLIMVGDSNQSIYEWRGAVDALSYYKDAPKGMLSQSFRFGQSVADVANSILGQPSKPTDPVMKGLADIPSIVLAPTPEIGRSYDPEQGRGGNLRDSLFAGKKGQHCVLCRTNAGAVATLLREVGEGRKAHIIGKVDEIVSFIEAAQELQNGRPARHPDLACFESWEEVQKYVKEDDAGKDLQTLVRLIDEFKCDVILSGLRNMPQERDADTIVATAHKSKGRQWPSVKLAGDFFPINKMDDGEVRLLYVAATRAQFLLDVSTCPPFLPFTDRQMGKRYPGLRLSFTKMMPSAALLEDYLATGGERVKEDSRGSGTTQQSTATPVGATSSTTIRQGDICSVKGDGTLVWKNADTFVWKFFSGEWMVRGPKGYAGKEVQVEARQGQATGQFTLEREFRSFPEATLYKVKK